VNRNGVNRSAFFSRLSSRVSRVRFKSGHDKAQKHDARVRPTSDATYEVENDPPVCPHSTTSNGFRPYSTPLWRFRLRSTELGVFASREFPFPYRRVPGHALCQRPRQYPRVPRRESISESTTWVFESDCCRHQRNGKNEQKCEACKARRRETEEDW
jgi:hypothetical protein